MSAGKILSIIGGALSLLTIVFLPFSETISSYLLGSILNIENLFGDGLTNTVSSVGLAAFWKWIIIVVIFLTLLSFVFQLIGMKVRILSLVGSIIPLLLSILFLLGSLIDVAFIDNLVSAFIGGMSADPLVEGVIPLPARLGPFALGTIGLFIASLLGLIGGIMKRDE